MSKPTPRPAGSNRPAARAETDPAESLAVPSATLDQSTGAGNGVAAQQGRQRKSVRRARALPAIEGTRERIALNISADAAARLRMRALDVKADMAQVVEHLIRTYVPVYRLVRDTSNGSTGAQGNDGQDEVAA